jgi:two-component system sensor histidine kinase KdpD
VAHDDADGTAHEPMTMSALLDTAQSQTRHLAALTETAQTLENRLALRTRIEALLSHELRTPITVILGVLQTLHGSDDLGADGPARELVARALAQCRFLAEMVEDLLGVDPDQGPSFTRAVVRRVRLGDLIDQAFTSVCDVLPASRVRAQVERDVEVSTAPSRFVAILVNLLENAAKYGGPHLVELRVAVDGHDLVIEVGDRGPGLANESPERLFEAFARGRAAGDRPGQGIGLYLVRLLASSLGGTATLEGRRGGGVRATVILPQRRSDDVDRGDADIALARPDTVA